MSKSSSTIIAETIAEVEGSMTEFKEGLEAALKKKAQNAEYADTADTLEGKTPAEVEALLLAEVTKHTSVLGQNVHNLNAGMVGSYNKTEYDARFDLMLDTDGGIPLDFYGDREFLAPSVTGSFESGSNTTPYNGVAFMMEDNGTLMMLRPGTDGDSAGVYYSYMRNAMTETDMTAGLVMSNVEYRPAYFPDGMRAKCILIGTQDIITGIMKDAVTGAHTGYFISLTNNTMDQTKHTGIFVPNGNFLNVQGPFPGMYHLPFGFIKGNYVYILHDLVRENKLGHRVWRIAKNDLITGIFNGATQIKGWTINRGSGGVVVRDDITIFDDVASSSNNIGQPSTTVWATNGSNGASAMTREDGSTGVMFSHYVQYHPGDNLVSIAQAQWYFRYEFDPNTKQVDVAQYHDQKASMKYTDRTWEFQYSACYRTEAVRVSHQAYQGGQDTPSFYNTPFGQLWMYSTTTYLSQNRRLYRCQYAENLDQVAVLAGEHAAQKIDVMAPIGRYGSALTASFRNISNVGDDVVNCMNFGRDNGQSVFYHVRSVLEGEPTFQYSSVTGDYAFKGFAPTADRKSHTTLGVSAGNFRRLLTEASPGVSKTSQARFASWNPTETSRAANIDRNMVASGSINVPEAVMSSLKSQILANLTARGYSVWSGVTEAAGFTFELVIPQAYTDMPPFVVVGIINSDRYLHQMVYTVTLSGTRQDVTGASIQPSTCVVNRSDAGGNTMLSLGGTHEGGQICIRRVNGGFMIGYGADFTYSVVGNGGRNMALMRYLNGTWSFNGNGYWDYFSGVAPAGWINLPSRGLFFVFSSEFIYSEVDCGTKMLGTLAVSDQPVTFTVGELRARSIAPATGFIVVSQRVVSAWTVYFADETPAMLDGFYSLVQPLNYNLNPATDGNKTFHVWLVRVGNALTYQVVAGSTAPPASPALYLGYFTTNNTGLNLIDVRKRVAIDGKMLSPDPRGSSIPLTSGTPNSYGRLNWK
jgi:hypothetical protein